MVYPKCNLMYPLYGAVPCAICDSAGYTQCFGYTSVCFCTSPQNLSVLQDFYSLLNISVEGKFDVGLPLDPVFDVVGLTGLKNRVNASLLA